MGVGGGKLLEKMQLTYYQERIKKRWEKTQWVHIYFQGFLLLSE